MKTTYTSLYLSLLALLFAAPAFSQPLPLDPAIRTGKLPNGFTYFIRKNKEPQKRATLYLVVKAGSILENGNQLGLAHFMEHMSFNGTRHFPKNELVEYLQQSGIRFGADLNAYTSFDETVYQLPIPTDDRELFRNGLQIMRDWAGEATLDPEEIDKERGVVLEEKRLRKGAGDRLQPKLFPFQVNGSRYAARVPIGTEQVLTTFQRPAITSFYRDWYRPDLEALIVVGDVDVAVVEKQVKALFASLRNPAAEKPRTVYRAHLLNQNRFLALTDPELAQTSVEIDFKTNSLVQGTKAQYRESLLRNLCSQLLGERLSELSKAPGAPVLNAGGGYQQLVPGLDALSVAFSAKAGQLQAGFELVYTALLQVKRYGFTDSEVKRVKAAYLAQMQALLREKDRQNSGALADELKRHFLVNEPAPGIAYETRLVAELLPGLTPAVIHTEISHLLSDHNRDILLTAPEKEKQSLPDEVTVNSWIHQLDQQVLKPYIEKTNNSSLMTQLPKPGKVISEVKDEQLGLTTWALSNGATVILKPTTFKNDQVLFSVFSPGGTSLYNDADYQSAANAANITAASGLGGFDAVSLPKMLAGKQVQVQPYISERWEGFQGGSSKTDLPVAMQLLHLYFTSPRKDTAMFRNIISRSEQVVANRYSNPQAVFQDSVSAVLGNYNYRKTGPTLEKLKQINLDRLYTIYQERFAGAGDFTFVFTGSFKPAEMKPLVEQYLASLPGEGQPEQARDLNIRIPDGAISKTIYAGREDKAAVMLVYHGDWNYTPENALKLSALKDVIQFRMTERLRESEGGAYAPSVQFQREHGPGDRYQLIIYFGCAPKNADKLIAAALEEIDHIKTEGPAADDLQKFRTEEQRTLETSLQDNRYWLSYLSTKLENGEALHSVLDQSERIKAITAADIQETARKYLDAKQVLIFRLLPKTN